MRLEIIMHEIVMHDSNTYLKPEVHIIQKSCMRLEVMREGVMHDSDTCLKPEATLFNQSCITLGPTNPRYARVMHELRSNI